MNDPADGLRFECLGFDVRRSIVSIDGGPADVWAIYENGVLRAVQRRRRVERTCLELLRKDEWT